MLLLGPAVICLNLIDCEIDSDGACQLANGLSTNVTLQTLHIEDNPGIEAAGAVLFSGPLGGEISPPPPKVLNFPPKQ